MEGKTEIKHPINGYEEIGLYLPGITCLTLGSSGPKMLHKVEGYIKDGVISWSERDRSEEALQYGCIAGNNFVREELAGFLTRQYGEPVDKEDLCVNSGSSDGLDSLLTHFFRPEQYIFVENPTFMSLTPTLLNHGKIKPVAINLKPDGMDLDDLEQHLKQLPPVDLSPGRPFRAAVYVMTVHHNPTGICYSAEKCKILVEIARSYDLLVISDDVYNVLNYGTDESDPEKFLPSPRRLFAYDEKSDDDYKGNVVSIGTFSKIAAPGLRIGWYEMPKRVKDLLLETYVLFSGLGKSAYLSFVMAEVIKSGNMDSHVHLLKKKHKDCLNASVKLIEENVTKYGVQCSQPSGGCFLWITLPLGVNASNFLEYAKERHGVIFIPGQNTSVVGDFKNCLRIGFVYYDLPEQIKGMQDLCQAIKDTLDEQ